MKLLHFRTRISRVLQQYRFSVFCFLYFFLLAFYLRTVFIDWNPLVQSFSLSTHASSLVYAALNAIIVLSLLNLISHVKRIAIIFVLLLAIIISIEATLGIAFSSQVTLGLFSSVIETNKHEALGAIKMYSCIAIPLLIVTGAILYLAYRELKSKKPFVLLSILLIIASFGICYGSVYLLMNKSERRKVPEELRISSLMHFHSVLGVRLPLLTNVGFASVIYCQEMYRFRTELGKPKTLPQEISFFTTSNSPNTIFIVIGESSLQKHYSLYGYDLPTTPFLDSLKNADRLSYYHAVSPASITRDALGLSLSFATPLDRQPLVDKKNAVALANDAGYESYWISNQDKIGMHDSYIGLIASYADTSCFFNFQKDDLELIPIVEKLHNPTIKQIFFIHLKGSHLEYKEKYDKADCRVLTNDFNTTLDYDRTIHHTDRVIGLLYNTIVNKLDTKVASSSLVFYFSDHGEIINKGHGFLDKDMDQFMIPFVVIPYNDTIDTNRIIDKYLVDGRLNTTNFNYILSEVMGYKISEKGIEKAKNDGLYYYHVDGKTYLFNDIKK